MSKWILGIDLGTTSTKVAVFDHRGELQASATVEYALLTPGTNRVEAPASVYMQSIASGLKKIREQRVDTRNVTSVGFSVQGETLVFLDEAGAPLMNAIVWMDNRAGEQAEALRARFSDETCYEVTGQVSFEACWPASKVLWLRENEPEVFSRVARILLLEDYILYQMTGKFVSEGSLLTSTTYWDIRTKQYWPEMLDFLGVTPGQLPEIRESGEVVGTVLPDVAEALGISPGARICTGCLDQAAAAIGVGNIKPGMFSENIGAALAICVPTKGLVYDPHRQMPVHYFPIPDTYMMHTFTTGGMCLRWFRDGFCQEELAVQDMSGVDAYDLLNGEANRVPPGADGLIALPHLQGSMAPDVNLNAKAVFYGLTLKHKKPHFVRAIMESLGYIIRRNLEAVGAMGLAVEQLRSMGGGSKSEIWNQIKADVTGKELFVTEAAQNVACLGAAILAGVAEGAFPSVEEAVQSMVKIRRAYTPNPENASLYQRQYEKFQMLFRALGPIYDFDARNP